jgi:phage gpG-like protein
MAVIRQIEGAGIRFSFELEGFEKVDVGLSRWGQDLQDWRPFFEQYVVPQFFGDIQSNFRTQGSYVYNRDRGLTGGRFGGWPPLSARYAAWKSKVAPGQPLMVFSGRLRASLEPDSPSIEQVRTIRPLEAILGTSVPYAYKHQHGDPSTHLPQRRIVFLASSQTYGRLAQRYIVDIRRARPVAA